MTAIKFGKRKARKLLEVVDAGLCSGLGEPIPGQMCVEAAICFALGLPRQISFTCAPCREGVSHDRERHHYAA